MNNMGIPTDAHSKPSDHFKSVFKRHQKARVDELTADHSIFDAEAGNYAGFRPSSTAAQELGLPDDIQHVIQSFLKTHEKSRQIALRPAALIPYEHHDLPGLYIFPSLLPYTVQVTLLDRMFHRDACNPHHRTNLHTHYDIEYALDSSGSPASLFDPAAQGMRFQPKDPIIHRPLNTSTALEKKLRWVTFGGQYDWTRKVYPEGDAPQFPSDIAALIKGAFPAMTAEAAILNLYSPGDTLSLHRDVSEYCNRPLASISFGCDGIFMAGLESDTGSCRIASMRLRSGDAVIMSGASRYAWHGVPKIIPGTCPDWLADWPWTASEKEAEEKYERWRGWMAGKRINLNVRQMYD